MNVRALITCCFLGAAPSALAQGYSGLGTDAGDYAEVTPPAAFAFPADHGPHPEFRIEWWYLTANLTDAAANEYGIQWTLFRIATAPEGPAEGWGNNQAWMAHAALTTQDEHFHAEKFARGGIGQAGVHAAPFEAWIDDWSLADTGGAEALSDVVVTASGGDFGYELRAVSERPPVPQGENGYSLKSPDGQASYYYSQPFFRMEGTLNIDGAEIPVTGQGWLDREWSSQPMRGDQSGWDWFSLHLDSGEKVMAYRFRKTDGSATLAGTWISPDGVPEPLQGGALSVIPLAEAEVAGRDIPVEWRVEIPAHGLSVETGPLNPQSWMATTFSYWEGPVRFQGSHTGRGYLEMTGYD